MPARFRSKSLKLGFSSKWTDNFQMYKLDLEKAKGLANQRASLVAQMVKNLPAQ